MANCELGNGYPIENEKHWLGHKEYLLRCPAADRCPFGRRSGVRASHPVSWYDAKKKLEKEVSNKERDCLSRGGAR